MKAAVGLLCSYNARRDVSDTVADNDTGQVERVSSFGLSDLILVIDIARKSREIAALNDLALSVG